MPHSIDFEDIENKLFLLEQLCYGSQAYSETITSNVVNEYAAQLEFNVSNYLIDCAIKTRITEDYLKDFKPNEIGLDISNIGQRARSEITLGTFQNKEKVLTIRGSCNKIVHATEIQLDWKDDTKRNNSKYWSGFLHLKGRYGKSDWHIYLNVRAWCRAMKTLHEILHYEIDWFQVYDI